MRGGDERVTTMRAADKSCCLRRAVLLVLGMTAMTAGFSAIPKAIPNTTTKTKKPNATLNATHQNPSQPQTHLRAASSFSLTPPIGSTRPVSVTSPVIARSRATGLPSARLSNAVMMVQPADGPSLGVAPCGTCTWMDVSVKKGLDE